MNEKTFHKSDEIEIDLGRVLRTVLDRAWIIAVISALCAAIMFAYTFFFVTPQYEASITFYVNNNAHGAGDSALSLSSGDLSTSRNLVDSYIVIMKTRESLNEVISHAGVSRTYTELRKMISAAAINETEMFEVTVVSSDPNEAEQIANAIGATFPERISSIIDGTSAKIVETAEVPDEPVSPSYLKNTIMGFLLGFGLAVGGIALREIFDITIRCEEDVTRSCSYPILASVPDMGASDKGSPFRYGGKPSGAGGNTAGKQTVRQPAFVGSGISFAASEAYKLLRTKLQFSFSDENDCHVIGITSARSGEGKSLSAANLAYTLSQLNKKVLLIDCDMRCPTLAEKLRIKKAPGLSSFLTGQRNLMDILQHCSFKNEGESFYVISAGLNPPNPVELLSSSRMEKMLEVLRKEFEYVIIDLPPVGEVSDALAVAKHTDGMLLVVRQNYCDRTMLSEAVRQFEFINARILGVVVNGTEEYEGSYTKQYGRKYISGYRHNGRSVSKPAGKQAKE